MTDMPKLLSCPRCGGPSEVVPRWSDHPSLAGHPPTHHPVCRHCGLTATGSFDKPEHAELWWNDRRADLATTLDVEGLVLEIDSMAHYAIEHAQCDGANLEPIKAAFLRDLRRILTEAKGGSDD